MNNCVMCKGMLIEGKVNHIVDIDGHIIIVKNVPANICTQCGEYYISHKIALIVEELVDKLLLNDTEIMVINYPSVAQQVERKDYNKRKKWDSLSLTRWVGKDIPCSRAGEDKKSPVLIL